MRQTATAEVRLDEGKATSSSTAKRATQGFGSEQRQLRSNFVAVRLDETENRTQQPGYPGDVGRKNAWARRVMGGDSILTIGRLCMANLLVTVVAAGGIHSSWAEQPVAGIAVEAAPSAVAGHRCAPAVSPSRKTDPTGATENKSPDPRLPPHQAEGRRLARIAEDDCDRRSPRSADEISSRPRISRHHVLGSSGLF
jgi:hypothetical protein